MVYPPQETETGFTILIPVTHVILGCLNELRQVIRNEADCYPGFTDEDRVCGIVSDIVDAIWTTCFIPDYRTTLLMTASIHEHIYECEPEDALKDERMKHKVISVIGETDANGNSWNTLAFGATEYLLSTIARLREHLWPSLLAPIRDTERDGFMLSSVNCKYVQSTSTLYIGVTLSE